MQPPVLPSDEAQRLHSLRGLRLLDSPAEERFDRLTRLVKGVLDVPIALISLVDAERQWFKSRQGLEACETGRDISFCGHTILADEIFEVCDARLDQRFLDNPLVTGAPHIRFYAGASLVTAEGYRIGTLCVISDQPRQLSAKERSILRDLADCVEAEINQTELQGQRQALALARQLGEIITRAQSQFIRETDRRRSFDGLLNDILALTGSEYGFIGEVLRSVDGQPYLKTFAITNIAWDDATRAFYEANAPQGMEFTNLQTLFGAALTSGEPVIANTPYQDPRRGGLPEGHPMLNTFLGVPVHHGGELVAMFGLSNRPGGYDHVLLDFLQPIIATLGQLVTAARIQQQQKQDEVRLRGLFELSPIGIALNDYETGAFIDLNESMLRPTGYTREAFVALSYWDLTPREYADDEARQLKALNNTGRYGPYEKEYIRKDGSRYPVMLNGILIEDTAGRKFIWSMVEDISERKAAEQELRERTAALRDTTELLENVLAAAAEFSIIATDTSGVIKVFNKGAENLLGYSMEDMVGRQTPAPLHLPEEMMARSAELSARFGRPIEGFRVFVEVAELDGSEAREWTYVHKSGRHIAVSLVVSAMRNADGDLTGYLGVAVDITDRKQAETALAEQAQHTQAILDHMIDGIIAIDVNGIIKSFNPAAGQIFGYAADAAIGRNVSMLMPSPHREAHDGYLRNYRATGVARILGIGREVEGQRKDGSLFPMDLAISEVAHQGQPLYVGMVRDITERKRVERMKSEFVSTVSHELRTPLTSISGALGLITGGALGELPPQARQMIAIAHKNSQRLTHLINDLLDMEKIAAGKLHFEMQVQPLLPLIEQALDSHRTYGAERRVSLTLAGETVHVEVRVDGQRLMQVLANLLSNAIKFSHEGGTVDVVVACDAAWVRVSVRDYGPGIPAAFQSRVFEKFAQADASDTRQKGGTGLGLAITRELVECMGGTIGFDSVEGEGATFWIELPRQEIGGLAVSGGAIATVTASPRILVVEDEPDIAQLLSMMLSRAGYQVDIALTGHEALAALQKTAYAALSLDLMLPDISGLEIIRALRQRPETANLPIVVISAKMEEGRLAINGDFSAIEWLAKPMDERHLLAVVERLVAQADRSQPRVLHVEDDEDLTEVIRSMVGERFVVERAKTLSEARARVALERFDVVILDIVLPDGSGWDLLPEIRAHQPDARVVILSGTDTSSEEARRVEAVLLKSQVSPRQLIDAIGVRIQSNRKSESTS